MVKTKKDSNIINPLFFIILSIFTFNIYELVWMYRNWKHFKEIEKTDIMPFWRAWFGLFFIASLFKKINNYSKKNGYNKNTYPVFFVILYILITVIAILSESIFVWLFMIILSPFIFLTTINASNYYYNKIEKNHLERPWKWRCLVLLLLCLLGWILIFL